MKRITIIIVAMFICLAVFSKDPDRQNEKRQRNFNQVKHEMIDSLKVKKEKITKLKSNDPEKKRTTQKKDKSEVKESSKTDKRKIKSKLKEMN
ncbi:MAG: hypothetical protein K9G70_00230 [Prolixibacteraceae bacterium]|nr:hypothetical protein [Prolixibacteraceae bacterium]